MPACGRMETLTCQFFTDQAHAICVLIAPRQLLNIKHDCASVQSFYGHRRLHTSPLGPGEHKSIAKTMFGRFYCKFGNFREILFSRIALKDTFAN